MPKMFSDTLVNIIFEYQLNVRLHHFSVNWRALPLASWYHSWGGGGGVGLSSGPPPWLLRVCPDHSSAELERAVPKADESGGHRAG